MRFLLVGMAVVGLLACNKSAGDTPPPASTGATVAALPCESSKVTGSSVPAACTTALK